MSRGRKVTPEFRREAVRLALTSGRTRREVADDLGVGLSSLTRWIGTGRAEGGGDDRRRADRCGRGTSAPGP